MHGLGAGTAAGEVSVRGDAGRETGARMTGGLVHVHGSTGDDAGQAMAGGVLRVDGHAGSRLAGAAPGASKGVTGGEIVVFGAAGDGVAALMRRGLVAVAGGVGPFAGRGMIAGTLLVLGPIGDQPGLGSKRGSIIAAAGLTVPPTYRLACTYEPPHVRLLLTSLRRRFAFPADAGLLSGLYDRYCGDAGEVGKGEILVWTGHARSSIGLTPRSRSCRARPAHYEVFRRLNYEWIDRYFGVEKVDRDMLDAPQAILDHGGHILVALIGGHPVGVCALVPEGEGTVRAREDGRGQ